MEEEDKIVWMDKKGRGAVHGSHETRPDERSRGRSIYVGAACDRPNIRPVECQPSD